jgi:penicillin-binding protein 2
MAIIPPSHLLNQSRFQVVTPYIAERIVDDSREIAVKHSPATNIELKSANVQDIIGAMIHVVHSARGTAKRIAKDMDFKVAGKTGKNAL